MITASQLVAIYGQFKLSPGQAQAWVEPLNAAMERFAINTVARQAAFLAQIGWESAGLTATMEKLSYSAELLLKTFPKYFNQAQAQECAHRSIAIANRVYANRYGNGDEASGDGWKYRGRGLIQITFRANYKACGDALGINLETNPDALIIPDNAALSAAWYFQSHGCNELSDKGDFVGITKKINGGTNGLEQRQALHNLILPLLTKGA